MSRQTGILRLKHLRETTEAKAEEMDALRPRFDRLASTDSAPRTVTAFNLFQTPPALADRLASMIPHWGRVLEPSAGLGRLYHAIRARTADHITMVENAPQCCRELYTLTSNDPATTLVQRDFLEFTGQFDSIVMNPPFQRGTDVRHILHALRLLAPGGNLVAICAAGPKQRKALEQLGDWIDLPPGSFRTEGTSVETAIVHIRK